MSIFDEPKVDGHCHLLDPSRFPYASDVAYKPAGQEVGARPYFEHVMETFGVRYALLVGPNSGYDFDNRCLLEALEHGKGKFKGVVVLKSDTPFEELQRLKSLGVIGVAFNVALNGVACYQDCLGMLKNLARLDMWAQFQVIEDQLDYFVEMIARSGVRLMIDHCGRPSTSQGLAQKGFTTLLDLGRAGQAVVKLSGYYKFSETGYPFADTEPYVDALVTAFGLEQCMWASDWPYLKAKERQDFGPALKLFERKFSAAERKQMMWDVPRRLLGFP